MKFLMELTTPGTPASIEATFLSPILKETFREAGILEKMLLRPTKSWKPESVPKFKSKASMEDDDWVHDITTEDKPYVWVTDGTKGGRANFSVDYRPKTARGTLSAGKGAGRVTRRGGRASVIDTEERNFQDTIVKQRTRYFPRNITKSITVGARKMFRGTRVQVVVL